MIDVEDVFMVHARKIYASKLYAYFFKDRVHISEDNFAIRSAVAIVVQFGFKSFNHKLKHMFVFHCIILEIDNII